MRRALHWFFEDRTTGRIVIGQWPNAPMWVFVAGAVARALVFREGAAHDVVSFVATAGLVVWALLEISRGVNPFRRVLGAAVLVPLLVRLFF